MRIPDSNQVNSPAQSELSSVKPSATLGSSSTSSTQSTSPGGDEISLSGPSQLIRSSASDRNERLASLAASVRSGQYDVSSATVSKSLVSETLARSANS